MDEAIHPDAYWASVAASSIDRQGIFAKRYIPTGTAIFPYRGEQISKQESTRRLEEGNAYLFILNDEFDLDGSVTENLARFVNHSCQPNCESYHEGDTIWISSVEDIQQGQELTMNYGYGLEDYPSNPCLCGQPDCIGYIVAEDHQDTVRLLELAHKYY